MHGENALSRDAFNHVFGTLIALAPELAPSERSLSRVVIAQLYDIFDANGDGVVDFTELAAGLSSLMGGTSRAKAQALFALYDTDGNGVISLEEMTHALSAMFKVLYATAHGAGTETVVSSDELAALTAERAFEDCDVEEGGGMVWAQFHRWYRSANDGEATMEEEEEEEEVAAAAAAAAGGPSCFAVLRRLTNLATQPVDEIVAIFAAASSGGTLNRVAFHACISGVTVDPSRSANEDAAVRAAERALFDAFDADGNGVVDFAELAAGLSVLCGGTRDEKARAAFALFDVDGDGYVTPAEAAKYLTSVFTAIYGKRAALAGELEDVTPRELAEIAVVDMFDEADLNADGHLNFSEFARWYKSHGGAGSAGSASGASSGDGAARVGGLAALRRISGLCNVAASSLVEVIAASSDDGTVSAAVFAGVARDLIAGGGDAAAATPQVMALFQLFTTPPHLADPTDDAAEGADFTRLACGLVALCGGSAESKAEVCCEAKTAGTIRANPAHLTI